MSSAYSPKNNDGEEVPIHDVDHDHPQSDNDDEHHEHHSSKRSNATSRHAGRGGAQGGRKPPADRTRRGGIQSSRSIFSSRSLGSLAGLSSRSIPETRVLEDHTSSDDGDMVVESTDDSGWDSEEDDDIESDEDVHRKQMSASKSTRSLFYMEAASIEAAPFQQRRQSYMLDDDSQSQSHSNSITVGGSAEDHLLEHNDEGGNKVQFQVLPDPDWSPDGTPSKRYIHPELKSAAPPTVSILTRNISTGEVIVSVEDVGVEVSTSFDDTNDNHDDHDDDHDDSLVEHANTASQTKKPQHFDVESTRMPTAEDILLRQKIMPYSIAELRSSNSTTNTDAGTTKSPTPQDTDPQQQTLNGNTPPSDEVEQLGRGMDLFEKFTTGPMTTSPSLETDSDMQCLDPWDDASQSQSIETPSTTNATPASHVPLSCYHETEDDEVILLHYVFATFCSPSPTLDSIRNILHLERSRCDLTRKENHDVTRTTVSSTNSSNSEDLPSHVLLHSGGDTPIFKLLQSPEVLLQLPLSFQLTVFRILIRLFTNESNAEYDANWLLDVRGDENENGHANKSGVDPLVDSAEMKRNITHIERNDDWSQQATDKTQTDQTKPTEQQTWNMKERYALTRRAKAEQVHQLYSMVRFRSIWRGKEEYTSEKSAIGALLRLLKLVLRTDRPVLVAPVARFLGLLLMAGVSVQELRHMLDLITILDPSEESHTNDVTKTGVEASVPGETIVQMTTWARLHLIRALSVAAEGASQPSRLIGKASPQCFFTFANGSGLKQQISDKESWPFRNDFGMALWFRAERFDCQSDKTTTTRPILLSVRTEDGGGMEVSLETFASSNQNSALGEGAATVVVKVYNSKQYAAETVHGKDGATTTETTFRLQGCVLSPRVWYHIAIRHTRPKLKEFLTRSLNDEISILLDGKLMTTGAFKFPKVSSSSGIMKNPLASSGSLLLRRSMGAGFMKVATPPPTVGNDKFHVKLGANFDGQTGALYLFNEQVSDATFKALFEVSAGNTSSMMMDSFSDITWDSRRGELARKENELSAELMKVDAEDIVVSGSSRTSTSLSAVFDLGDDDHFEAGSVPPELMNAAFRSKLFLVWDPSRTSGKIAFDVHSGAHVPMNFNNVQPWRLEGAKDVIDSIGGVQRLLKLFDVLIGNDKGWSLSQRIDETHPQADAKPTPRYYIDENIQSLIPPLLNLLASFLNDHSDNAREMLRCGGIEIVERSLQRNKEKDAQNAGVLHVPSKMITMSTLIRMSPQAASELVDALLTLQLSCSHNVALETKFYSRILFNIPLWFGNVAKSMGVALHASLLPVLSAIAKSSPNKVRECVGVKDIIESINEYTSVGNDLTTTRNSSTLLFDRSTDSGLSRLNPLTVSERRHVVDILLGVVVAVLTPSASSSHVSPFINFISFGLDYEWELASIDSKDGTNSSLRTGIREERYMATYKACMGFLFLIQSRPLIPDLHASLEACLSNTNGIASWILCAMVNSFDDLIRSIGIRALTAFMDAATSHDYTSSIATTDSGADRGVTLDSLKITGQLQSTATNGAKTKLTQTMQYVGTGLGVIGHSHTLSNMLISKKLNTKIIYKLLWHLLKCHRERLGRLSHASLVQLLVDDGPILSSTVNFSFLMNDIVIADDVLRTGYIINGNWAKLPLTEVGLDQRQKLRNKYAVSTILRLLRFLPNDMKDRWLFDLLALIRMSPSSLSAVLSCHDWQPSLFHLISEIVEEIKLPQTNVGSNGLNEFENTSEESAAGPDQRHRQPDKNGLNCNLLGQSTSSKSVHTRFDLALQMYSTLLGHCVRQGGDGSFHAIEEAASLQRVWANGDEVFSVVLSHLLAELLENGTVMNVEELIKSSAGGVSERNRSLKQSARLVTTSIQSNGSDGMDMASAVRHWRCLRHITAVSVAVITSSGFGVANLFDYCNNDGAAVDDISGGLHGIRLADTGVGGITSFDAFSKAGHNVSTGVDDTAGFVRESCRVISVTLASQLLSLLDAFVFPDSLDASLPESQLHGLALVRTTEPRIGISQGPLLASLLRLSLVLLSNLEPSSVKFLQCCSRLRCFLHWTLELIRESIALGGYSSAFHELTAPLDRLVLAVVLQCHRAFSRCSSVLHEIESSPFQKYFSSEESKKKNYKRLLRAVTEMREIVLAAYRGRNEVLRAALSLQAYEALQSGLEDVVNAQKHIGTPSSKEGSIRAFLANSWVTDFQDVDIVDNLAIPEQVSNGQIYRHRTATNRGRLAIEELASESKAIVNEYDRALNGPFEQFCEDQKQWAQTDAVRDLECEGDTLVKKLSGRYRSDVNDSISVISLREEAAAHRWYVAERKISEPWTTWNHWKVAKHTDRFHRRILLHRNRRFDSHEEASYALTLGKERDKALKDREERLRRKTEEEEENKQALERASEGLVPYYESGPADEEHDEVDDYNATIVKDEVHGLQMSPEEENDEPILPGEDWDQIESDEFADMEAEEEKRKDTLAWAKFFIWSHGESMVGLYSVVVVTLQTLTEGQLLLTTRGLYFHATDKGVNMITKEHISDEDLNSKTNDRRWRLSRLTGVHGRRYMLRAQALELFFADTHELFINFNGGTRERDRFYSKLRNNCKTPILSSPKSLNPRIVFKRSHLTEMWRMRKMSNFQYLMCLNIMAGRTYNDIGQYPVFPWILNDYTSQTLDLTDSRVYRDLTKPVGALNPDRLASLIARYNDLDGFPEEEKFLYGSHYSSPGFVLHYLIRAEPFTTMAIQLQSNRFDCPDRLFFDLSSCWSGCLNSTSDVKELIPEFFTCPEIFINTNQFPLGETQGNTQVNDVKLPPWANGSAYEFVRLHRLALESEYVSRNLNHWVDLIFGYQQRGPEAAAAHNVFHYLSYEGSVDLDKITDEIDRQGTETHIQHFGQTPSQLLVKDPHPSRLPADECWQPLCSEVSNFKDLRCHMPLKQFGGMANSEASGAVVSIQVLNETIIVVYADTNVGTYRWAPTSSNDLPFSFKKDKLRSLGCWGTNISPGAPGSKEMMLQLGNWSFGMTLRRSIAKDGIMRRATSRNLESNGSSSAEASALLLSCGHWDHTVKVHSLDGMRVKSSESGGHRGPIRCLSVTDDGSLMITGGQDATCRVWVVDHPDMAVALLDGYVQTALGTDGSKEKILSCCHVLWGHETPITCLAVSSDLDVAISGSMDGIICVHSVRRGKFVRSICVDDFYLKEVSLRRHNQEQTPVRKLALDRNGTFVAHLENGMLQMYTVNGVRLCCTDAGEKLHAMEICSGGEMLVTGGESCHVVIRTLSDLGVRCVLDLSRHGPIRCISFTPADLNPSPQFMYIGTDDGRITIVDSDALHDTKANEERPKWILHESGTTSIMSGHEQNKIK